MAVPTLFIRAFYTESAKSMKKWNKNALTEEKNLRKYNDENMIDYIKMLDAKHFIWENQEYSDIIINKIYHLFDKLK